MAAFRLVTMTALLAISQVSWAGSFGDCVYTMYRSYNGQSIGSGEFRVGDEVTFTTSENLYRREFEQIPGSKTLRPTDQVAEATAANTPTSGVYMGRYRDGKERFVLIADEQGTVHVVSDENLQVAADQTERIGLAATAKPKVPTSRWADNCASIQIFNCLRNLNVDPRFHSAGWLNDPKTFDQVLEFVREQVGTNQLRARIRNVDPVAQSARVGALQRWGEVNVFGTLQIATRSSENFDEALRHLDDGPILFSTYVSKTEVEVVSGQAGAQSFARARTRPFDYERGQGILEAEQIPPNLGAQESQALVTRLESDRAFDGHTLVATGRVQSGPLQGQVVVVDSFNGTISLIPPEELARSWDRNPILLIDPSADPIP